MLTELTGTMPCIVDMTEHLECIDRAVDVACQFSGSALKVAATDDGTVASLCGYIASTNKSL